MKCENCGAEMDESLNFCESCGAPMRSPEETEAQLGDAGETGGPENTSETSADGKEASVEGTGPESEEEAVVKPIGISKPAVGEEPPIPGANEPGTPATNKLQAVDPKRLYNTIGMICGAAMVVAGLAVIFGVNSHVDTTMKFGGDFQTESYQATALAVEAVVTLAKVCGGILAGLGAFTACYFGRK